jgi:hypothetical protein
MAKMTKKSPKKSFDMEPCKQHPMFFHWISQR